MINLTIDDHLAERLEGIASRENLTIDEVLRRLLDIYSETAMQQASSSESLKAMAGMFDEDVGDLSMTVRETMEAYYRDKYGNSD